MTDTFNTINKVVHLISDAKFAPSQKKVFETFYPGKSLYVLSSEVKYDENSFDDVDCIYINKSDRNEWKKIEDKCDGKIDYVFVYYAISSHINIALYLQKKYGCKIYWMFFGADLYSPLYVRYNYPLFDCVKLDFFHKIKKRLIGYYRWPLFKKFVKRVDSFCFWNPYDLELLKRYIPCNPKFRMYTHGTGSKPNYDYDFPEKIKNQVQVNHSASFTGNHITVLRKLSDLDFDRKLNVLMPLSYGSQSVLHKVESYVKSVNLGTTILKDFMPLDEYFKTINSSNSAIFGHNRQEAGGNISSLLRTGTKVFLRNSNNLLQFYRDYGVHIFSFEDDLNSIEDLLTPLSDSQKIENAERLNKVDSYSQVAESLKHFFE